jgi:hypothetical protein
MKHKKTAIILAILVLVICIAATIVDIFLLENGEASFTSGVGLILILIVMPVAVIITILLGSTKIVGNLASSKVSSSEKKGMLKRLLIAIIVGAVGLGILGIINLVGTALIDI